MNFKNCLIIFIGIFLVNYSISISQQSLTPTSSFLGTHNHERVGYHLHTAGDVNGDGYDDFLIGTFHNETNGFNSGAAYLILGNSTANWGNDISLSNADARFIGQQEYDAVGYFLGGAGDINGDGFSDMIIGAPAGDDLVPEYPGHVYLVFGKSNPDWGSYFELPSNADASFDGENQQDLAGLSVAFIGDINSDGYDDIICGAPFNDYGANDAGKAYLILGKANGWQRGLNLNKADASFYGSYDSGLVGYGVDGVGDVNGDDIPDFAIGARGEGKVYLFFGRKSVNWGKNYDINRADVIFVSEQDGNYTGWRVSGAGDVNKDNHDDFLIGAPYHDQNENEDSKVYLVGKVYLILGRSSGWKTNLSEADASYYGEAYDDEAGWDTQGAGDVDGDGYNDFLIGAWYNDSNGKNSGKMYLIRGKPSGWQRNVSLSQVQDYFIGEHAGDYAGYSCSNAGDVNGDGLSDIITSASYYSEFYKCGGKIYIFVSENAQPAAITIISPNGGENWNVSSIHDISWNSENTSGTVKLEYSTDNGVRWKQIIASTEDDGIYSWTIPHDPSMNCLVKVTDSDGSPSDKSDAVFTISEVTYTLIMYVDPPEGGTTDPPTGQYTYYEGTVVNIFALPNPGHGFVNWIGEVPDPDSPATNVTMDGDKTVTANFAPIPDPITDLRASVVGEYILLEWSPSPDATSYHVYRDNTYDFVPDQVNATNRIAESITDEDPATNGVQWTDTGNGAKIVGDVNINYFYRVTALFGAESNISNLAGEFDYPLITTSSTDINEIVVMMNTQNTRKPIFTAEDLANAIPYCSDVYYWDAKGQGTVGHPKGVPFNNFSIYPGYPYIVNVTSDTVWTVAGSYSDTSFQLITTDGTDINHIGVPLSKDILTTAEELGNDIPNCTDVYYWDAEGQGTVGHVVGLPFENFVVRAGYPYYVNITADTVWPSTGGDIILSSSVIMTNGLSQRMKKGLAAGGVPHTVYGTLSYWDKHNFEANDLKVKAWIIGRSDEVITDASVTTGCDGHYWWIGVSNFATAWQVGDSLQVEITDATGRLQANTIVVLTEAGSDHGGKVHFSVVTGVDELKSQTMPQEFILYQNYPNPFNPETIISFQLPEARNVILKVYNLHGAEICTLLNEKKEGGQHQVTWHGKDNLGQELPSGVYFIRIVAGDYRMIRKMAKVR
jgi:hypothetical protein